MSIIFSSKKWSTCKVFLSPQTQIKQSYWSILQTSTLVQREKSNFYRGLYCLVKLDVGDTILELFVPALVMAFNKEPFEKFFYYYSWF